MLRFILPLVLCGTFASVALGATGLIFAHRGYSDQYPENTMLAFRKAVEAGAQGVELDVQQSSDGVIVVVHDTTVDRTTNGSGAVEALSWAELVALDAGHGTRYAGDPEAKIPRLDELLDYFRPLLDFLVIVEIKGSRNIGADVARLVKTKGMEHRAWIEASAPDILDSARAQVPAITTLLQGSLPEVVAVAAENGYRGISVRYDSYSSDPQYRRDTEAAGLFASLFTPDTESELLTAQSTGALAITTNHVARAVALGQIAGTIVARAEAEDADPAPELETETEPEAEFERELDAETNPTLS